jgi:hypothetical protein
MHQHQHECDAATGAGTRDAAVEAVQHLPDLAAVALAHVVDYLRSFQSEGVLQQVSCGAACRKVLLRSFVPAHALYDTSRTVLMHAFRLGISNGS